MMQDPLTALANSAAAAPPGAGQTVHGLKIFGVTLIGATRHNWHKLVLTIGFIAVAWIVAWILRQVLKLFIGSRSGTRFQFWAKQGVSLIVAAILILGVMSI
jgi:hypothetical protein